MDRIERPFRMIVTGKSETHPERIAYDAAQMEWSEIHLMGGTMRDVPSIIHHSPYPKLDAWGRPKLSLSVETVKHGSLVIFGKYRTRQSRDLMESFLIRGRLFGISVICIDVSAYSVRKWMCRNTDFCVFTSEPRKQDWAELCWPPGYSPCGNFVLKRGMGRVIMAKPNVSINWDAIAVLVNLSQVNSELRYTASRSNGLCPVMDILSRNYAI